MKHTTGVMMTGGGFTGYSVWIGGMRVANCGHAETFDQANARRIAAAWNACAGITTELLEAGFISKLVASHKELLADSIQAYKDAGGCDHPVGICMCGVAAIITEAERIQAEVAGTFEPKPYLWPEEAENRELRESNKELQDALQTLEKAFVVAVGDKSPFAKLALAPARAVIENAKEL